MRVFLIADNYPSSARPWTSVFVHELAYNINTFNADTIIISPESIFNLLKHKQLAPVFELFEGIPVYHPRYISFSSIYLLGGVSTYRFSVKTYVNTVLRHAMRLNQYPDICYGHFLYPSGLAAMELASYFKVPAVVALGESSFENYESNYGPAQIHKDLSKCARIIVVSNAIKKICVNRYNISAEQINVFPNAVDDLLFCSRNQITIRKEFGLPLDRPIVIFVGHFIDRKGPLRLLEAIQCHPEIGAVFLGNGPQVPKGSQVLFCGAVPHKEVGKWLSAADIFVLPTLDEGSCNAVLEALASGLPIISSDRPFNYELLDPSVAILVDPLNIKALEMAILNLLRDPSKRIAMSLVALKYARKYKIKERAGKILNVLNDVLLGYKSRVNYGNK